jgi:hypothetical protein
MEIYRPYFSYHYLKKLNDQFCELDILMQYLEQNDDNDSWSCIWGNDHYSLVKVYKHLIGAPNI